MATLTIQKSGKTIGYNIQWYEGKVRRTIYLGGSRYNRKTAERLKEVIETLIYYRRNGIAAPAEIQMKLAKAGLATVNKSKTCQELWDTCLKHKTDVKASTVSHYHLSRKVLFETFSPAERLWFVRVWERLFVRLTICG
jgi:hypothetical protein